MFHWEKNSHIQNKSFLININEHTEILWKKPVKNVLSTSRTLVAVSILLSASKNRSVTPLWLTYNGEKHHFFSFCAPISIYCFQRCAWKENWKMRQVFPAIKRNSSSPFIAVWGGSRGKKKSSKCWQIIYWCFSLPEWKFWAQLCKGKILGPPWTPSADFTWATLSVTRWSSGQD